MIKELLKINSLTNVNSGFNNATLIRPNTKRNMAIIFINIYY